MFFVYHSQIEVEREQKVETFGAVAQLVERLLCKQDVRSSNRSPPFFLTSTVRISDIFLRACSSVG